MVELSEKDFQIFKEEAQFWIDKFGLLDWRIDFLFEDLEENRAECRINYYGKIASIVLNKWCHDKINQSQVAESAFHEVCELLLYGIQRIALDEKIPYEERESLSQCAVHGAIRRLENSVFKMRYGKEKNNANCTIIYE